MGSHTNFVHIFFVLLFFGLALGSCTPKADPNSPSVNDELANSYPGDVGIANDENVIFVEMAEANTLADLFLSWTVNSGTTSVTLDTSTKPALSPGTKSLQLFTTAGTYGTSKLYKLFPGGYEGTVYARWYVKYNSYGTNHHSGPRLGGNYPESPTPNSHAGQLPSGSDFFYISAEPSQGKTAPVSNSTFDFYNYWMHQRGNTAYPGLYYGNSFINLPTVNIDMNVWNCIEVQLSLNDPVTAYNGELGMWINGIKVSTVTAGTKGTWAQDHFTPSESGLEFEGFQWRNNQNLKINFFQLEHFVDNDSPGLVNRVNYDHIVVAKKRIGCLK